MWDDASVRNAFAARLAGRIGWRRRLDIFFLLAYNKNHTFTAFSLLLLIFLERESPLWQIPAENDLS